MKDPGYINSRNLAHFVAVFEHASLRDAANACGVTQPAMSKSISRLEDQLQHTLFFRGSGRLEPREAAHELYRFAKMIEAETRQSILRMAEIDSRINGSIRVGAGEMWSLVRIPQLIRAFMTRFPGISLDLHTKPMEQLVEDLENRDIDMAVGDMAVSDMDNIELSNDYVVQDLQASWQKPFVRAAHPLLRKDNPTTADLVEYPWVGILNSKAFEKKLHEFCEKENVRPPRIRVRATSLPSMMAIAETGDYVAVLPIDFQSIARTFGLIPIDHGHLTLWPLKLSVVIPSELQNSVPVRALTDMIREAGAQG